MNKNDEFKKKFAFPENETLLWCSFNFNLCEVDDFDWYHDWNYGNCYRFNAGTKKGLKVSKQPGDLRGFIFTYFLGAYDFQNQIIDTKGLKLFIHNHTEIPSNGIDISSGHSTSIAITRTITERLGEPYNKCIKNLNKPEDYDSILYKELLSKNISYSKSLCMDYCFQRVVNEKCGCNVIYIRMASDKYTYCHTMN